MRGKRLVCLILGAGALVVLYEAFYEVRSAREQLAAATGGTALRLGRAPSDAQPAPVPVPQLSMAAVAAEAMGLVVQQPAAGPGPAAAEPPPPAAPPEGQERTAAGPAPAAAVEAGPPPNAEPPPEDRSVRNGDPADWCDRLIPRYDIRQWEEAHRGKVPDHPAIFTGAETREDQIFRDLDTFLKSHGDHRVNALPEYAQAGGHLAYIGVNVQGEVKLKKLRELVESWNDTHLYYNDFKCSPLCQKVVKMFGTPGLFNVSSTKSTNFLIGGPESGLPFHKHTKTWQGLSVGRKAWYVVPSGSMSEAVHDATGPYIFPVRSYHRAMQRLPVGQRPLYCVQHPGEIFYIPDFWWHSTMNLDGFQLAYGAKPCCKDQVRTDQHTEVMKLYPRQVWDTDPDGGFGWSNPFPYSIIPRVREVERACKGERSRSTTALEEPLRRIAEQAARAAELHEDEGMRDTAAFAHCVLAKKTDSFTKTCNQSSQVRKEMTACTQRWRMTAASLSAAVSQRECPLRS